MRLLRALSAALLLLTSIGLVIGEPGPARAQNVEEAEDAADEAQRRAQVAESLVGEAASARSGIEEELADSIIRLNELNNDLSRVSADLDRVRQAVSRAETDLASLGEELTVQAVDAYVRAVEVPAASLIGTGTAEDAIVATSTLSSSISSDQAEIAGLTLRRRDLDSLRATYAADQERVEEIQAAADSEAERLQALWAEADSALAGAVAEARTADAAFRSSLDAVETARAREEEQQRQRDRGTTTTSTTTAPPAATTTTTTTAGTRATTSTTAPPPPDTGGPFSPNVERWRPTVGNYFPASRVDDALAVISCESNGDPAAYNPYSGAGGLFQFLPSTWAATSERAGFGGADVFDGEANIGTAAWLSDYYASRGSDPWAPWTCKP